MHLFKKALLLLVLAPGIALAQFGAMQMPNTDYFPILLLSPAVQHDLGLSSAVSQQEQGLIMQMGMQMLPMLQRPKGQSPEQKQQFMGQMFKTYQDLENKTIGPLNTRQRARLRQLTLQYYGPTALSFPKIARAVGLTSAQKTKIYSIISARGSSMMRHMPTGSGQDMMSQVNAMRSAQNAARAAIEKQVNEVLNPTQKSKWSALQGKKLPGVTDMGGLGSILAATSVSWRE